MSAHQLHRMLDISYEAAWFLFHRLREAADDIDETGPLGGENKVVETDETYIGGKEANKHAWKRKGVGGGPGGKMPVVSLVERDGRTSSFHVANVTAKNLRPIIVKHADRKSHLMTDDSRGLSLDRRRVRRAFAASITRAEEYVQTRRLRAHQHGRKPFRAVEARRLSARSTTSARRTCTATSPSSISAPTPAT